MYHFEDIAVENAYKAAMRASTRPYNEIVGVLMFSDGSTMNIDPSILPQNSVSISKQCIDDDELMFGGVYSSILKISILTDKDRYAFYGATLNLKFEIEIDVNEENEPIFAEVPLGVFTVADAERPNDRVILTCYDNMTMLSKELGGEFLTGNTWEMFQLVAQNTGIQLDFDETDLAEYDNWEYSSDASTSRGFRTYYDVVKMLCQLLGCFAYAERNGKLAIKTYSITSDLTLTRSHWYSLVPADYKSNYVGISITSLAGTYTEHTTSLLEQGLIMVIEDAPAWDYGSEIAQQTKTQNLFNLLRKISGIDDATHTPYTPCSIDMPSDPAFDCGDRLELVTKNGTIETLITSIDWKWHQGMSIDSEGLNPYLESSSALASETNRILNQAIERSKLQFISFTNSGELKISNGDTLRTIKIGQCNFNPSSKTDALFVATILVDIEVDDETETEEVSVPIDITDQQGQPAVITDLQGNPLTLSASATNTYYRDGKVGLDIFYRLGEHRLPNEDNPYIATENLEDGQHIITVTYPLTALEPNTLYEFEIYITLEEGGSVTIPARTLQASIIGQELTDISGFSGLIQVEDPTFTLTDISNLGVINLYDNGEVDIIENPPYANVSDSVLLYNTSSVGLISLAEGSGSYAPQIFLRSGFDLMTEDNNNFASEDGIKFITEGTRSEE